MSEIETRIQQAAAKNRELLTILAQTDHAIPDLAQQTTFVADLEKEAASSKKRVDDLARKRVKELKEHEKYRDSTMKRFMHKAVGKREKFEDKAAKEEREYFEVLQEEHKEQEMNKNLNAQLEEARNAKSELENIAGRHRAMQQELDNLYNAIFSGPTPGFPEEDQRESASNSALQSYHDTRTKAEAEQHAVRLLTAGLNSMRGALGAMENALSHSRMDMFGGGSMSDMMERNALHQAEMQVQEARMNVMQAQRMSPFVQDLPPVKINHGNIMTDVFFDNIFTDMAFHDEIKRSMEEVKRCAHALGGQLQEAKGRHQTLEQELRGKEKTLAETRVALQKERESAFERVAGEAK